MRSIGILSTVVLYLLLASPATPSTSAEDLPPAGKKIAEKPAKSAEKLSDKEVSRQWAELLARREKISKAVDKLVQDFDSADTQQKKKLKTTFDQLNEEFQKEVAPGLQQLGPIVYKKDPTDPLAAQFVIGNLLPRQNDQAVPDENYVKIATIVKGLTRTDKDSKLLVENILGRLLDAQRFSEVISIADKLAESKDVSAQILIIDSIANLSNSDFDRAAELAKRAADLPDAGPAAAHVLKDSETYVGFWKKELEIRAKEAAANDLPRVLLKTSKGDIVLELFENEAPNTVANFISLVEAGKYDGTQFHRVIPGFMARGGDPNTLDDDPENDGFGGPGYTIACECYNGQARMHFKGSLTMAHAGKDSGGSQFFLTHGPTSQLNWSPEKEKASHTVFGRVLKGMDVVLKLVVGDTIESAKVLRKRDHEYVPETLTDKSAADKPGKNSKKGSPKKPPADE